MFLSSTVRRAVGRPDALHAPPGDVVCFGDKLRCVCRLLYDGRLVDLVRYMHRLAMWCVLVTGDGVSVVYCTTDGWST